MNRRGFLSTITAGLAAAALDPERLLWVPGAKTIFIPPVPIAYRVQYRNVSVPRPHTDVAFPFLMTTELQESIDGGRTWRRSPWNDFAYNVSLAA